ncbi:MAG: D-glycero-beta-D-manno-heptose-7-phosphate kinase [Gemmatimonadota bacterium]
MTRLSRHRAASLLQAMKGARVVVLGDVMLDRYLSGRVDRISPEAPVPVLRVEEERMSPGGAANVAVNVAALGGKVRLLGVVGTDPAAGELTQLLQSLDVEPEGLVPVDGRCTTVKTRVLAQGQQVVRVDREEHGAIPAQAAAALLKGVSQALEGADVLILEDYNKGVMTPQVIRGCLEAAARGGIATVVDPKRDHFFLYAGCTVFKPNAKELEGALGEALRPDDAQWMEACRSRLNTSSLLLTLGSQGMALQTNENLHVRVPALAREVYDVSGAGDTVSATVALALAAGATLMEATLLANQAASLEVAKAGVATVSPQELLDAL